jgi:hypothetical protein
MDIQTIRIDSVAVNDGLLIDKIPGWGDAKMRVRGLKSTAYKNARDAKMRAVNADGRDENGSVLTSEIERIQRECAAEVLLLDWEGLTDGGKPLPYSLETAKTLILNPDFHAFADAVIWCADQVDERSRGKKEALEKN